MERVKSLKIALWKTADVKPYPTNPRRVHDQAIKKVADSLKKFGWRQPIVVNKDGIIVVGHTRLLAAELLKLDKVPVHVASDMSPTEIDAYRIADNRTGEETGWDLDLLADELQSLSGQNIDLSMIGFDPIELESLLGVAPEVDEVVDAEAISASRLDQTHSETECPKCGHRWQP